MRNTFSNSPTRWPRMVLRAAVLAIVFTMAAWASSTFGKVVSIGGAASDIALDEGRGVLYIANYTANRIEVMNTSNNAIPRSINVPYPGSISLSPDGTYLVAASYANFTTTGTPANILTIINLTNNAQQTISVGSPPLGVAFGADGLALVLTTTDFALLDPVSASLTSLGKISTLASQVLPVTTPDFPPQITTAALGVSGDGMTIYGITTNFGFNYSVASKGIVAGSYTASPPLGPRVVSVNQDGSMYVSGWAAFSRKLGAFAYQFPNASGTLNKGSIAIDSAASLVYAQIPDPGPPAPPPTTQSTCLASGICITLTIPPPAGTPPPVLATPPNLMIADLDNFTVRQRLRIAENLAGRSVLNRAHDTMYSISDSGVTVFPIGSLRRTLQVTASQEDVVFQGAFCNRQTMKQQINIVDANGGAVDFKLSLVDPSLAGSVSFSPSSGITPVTVTVSIDPTALQSQNGTTSAMVRIDSASAANLQLPTCPVPVANSSWPASCFRLLINNPDPDQKGKLVNVPGVLSDVLADPARNQFYVLRQDKNQVLVFDAASYTQTGTLRTSNTPTQMAITADGAYLLVGHDNAQTISVFDLNKMQPATSIRMPDGSYPRSVAVAGGTILAASRVVTGVPGQISQVDLASGTATAFPSLGPFTNSVHSDTVLAGAARGAFVMGMSPDGKTLLYDANAGTFTVARQDYTSLGGAYAASDLGQFVIDNHFLDSSLVEQGTFDLGAGGSSGFAFLDPTTVVRTTGPVTSGTAAAGPGAPSTTPGVIERVNVNAPASPMTSTRTLELPLFPSSSTGTGISTSAFVRSLAPLPSGNAIISLTRSGFSAFPANFDAATAQPVISNAMNTANQAGGLTAGSLITLQGSNLSAANASSNATPAPTTLGSACVTINGNIIPLFMVSPSQINGQLPLNAPASGNLIVYTTGGVSSPFPLSVQPTAPSVIQVPSTPDSSVMIPAIYRVSDNLLVTLSNPVHKGDKLVIYLSGLGPTNPVVDAGLPSPSNPLAVAIIPPVVTLNGVTMPVTFAGLTPGQIGVYQINVDVPQGVTQGLSVPLMVAQGTASSTVYVRVVQ